MVTDPKLEDMEVPHVPSYEIMLFPKRERSQREKWQCNQIMVPMRI